MKLKQKPSDFIVEEIPNFNILSDKDDYKIFLMEKKEIDTFDSIEIISKKLRIPRSQIGFAGLKDKHGITKQYISLPAKYNTTTLKYKEKIRIEHVGYLNRKIKIGDLHGNIFTITARDIKQEELQDIYSRASSIPKIGVPNYFDSQRFRSVIDKHFIAKYILQKNYEQAVKIFLTKYIKSEKRTIKEEKRIIQAHWNNLSTINVRNKILATIIKRYLNTNNWLEAYKKIPSYLREMFVNAYQSYLWNECIKEVFRQHIDKKKLYSIRYSIGYLLFYKKLSSSEIQNIPLSFKTISHKIQPSEFEQKIISKILSQEGVALDDFDIKKTTGNFFKTRERAIIIKPNNLLLSDPVKDELNYRGRNKRFKITLSFTLPKGSYATIVTKRMFNQ
ncbi:MAG: tRNA pseudouridine(13) synthase TruD [Thermoplasmata archaeon]|nr:MAG: tRNA pseudouridine(13) synthase TruD [Thermoplasmata archaeon]